MKKFSFLFVLTFLLSMASISAFAYDIAVKNADGVTIYYSFTNDKTELAVVMENGYSGNVVIPASVTYNGTTYSVTSIGYHAFYDCKGLTSVTIPNSVTYIGQSAFEGCSGLTSVHITDLEAWCKIEFVKYVDSNPLYNAHHLFLNGVEIKNLVIPNSVTNIGSLAFCGCSGLTSITIPNSVTSIGESAFYLCSGLTSITIPNSVTSIGGGAFSNCSGLTSITIPNSVTSIGGGAFSNCSGLTSITIPNSVTSIGKSAFNGCYRINTIYSLNPTPPTCYSTSTFSSFSQRNEYDVYTYATLHVPMGCKEIYSSAYEWRYFNKIKEDMQANGKTYYANLTVKQGTTGYTRQAIKADETYTIYIGSLGENKVNAVTFNGVDVTDEVQNGYYTTPEIKEESVLSISYEVNPSAVSALSLDNVKVTGYDGEIKIFNIEEPSTVSVYSPDGKLIKNVPSALGNITLPMAPNNMYVVKVGTHTYKLAM